MKLKQWQDIFHVIANANANAIVQLAIQIKNGIMKHANVSVEITTQKKNITFEILAHVFVRMVKNFKSIVCD